MLFDRKKKKLIFCRHHNEEKVLFSIKLFLCDITWFDHYPVITACFQMLVGTLIHLGSWLTSKEYQF